MAYTRANISIDEKVLADLDKLAQSANMSRSGFIEMMVVAASYLEKNDFKSMIALVTGSLMKSIKGIKK